jgi:hypothetical protein
MAKKTVADAAKAKAQKQKKMAIGLSIFLVLAMAYAVHTMLGLNSGGASGSKPEAAPLVGTNSSVPASSPAGTPSALPSAPSLGAAAPSTSTPVASQNGSPLIAAVSAPTGEGQLESFSLFESKDPFNAGGPGSAGGSSGGSSGSSGGSSGGTSGGTSGTSGGTPPKTPPAPPVAPPTSAVIAVNGVSESVTSGSGFPAADPTFQLVSLTNKTAKVSILGGSYADGASTVTLTVGKGLTLVNTADGTRYTLLLMPQGTTPTGSSASTGETPGATTTPTTTTTGG